MNPYRIALNSVEKLLIALPLPFPSIFQIFSGFRIRNEIIYFRLEATHNIYL